MPIRAIMEKKRVFGVNPMQRRIFLLLLAFSMGFLVLLIRLLYLQLIASGVLSGAKTGLARGAVSQREHALVLDAGRGHFYFRDASPITGEVGKGLAVFPVGDFRGEQAAASIAQILKINRAAWSAFVDGLKAPKFWTAAYAKRPYLLSPEEAQALAGLKLPFLHVLPVTVRYPENMPAQHVIGFIAEDPDKNERSRQQVGASGLERTFDAYLRGIGQEKAIIYTDGRNNPLQGLGLRISAPDNRYYPLKIITTLDAGMQTIVEEALDEAQVQEGAVVLLDAQNNDVLAMASRPRFNPYSVDPADGKWQNRALSATAPGSIFKTVIAAAALDAHVVQPQEQFFCGGELGKFHFSCWKKNGHGRINFAEAYAESCNIVFANVAERLKPQQIVAAASAFGIGQPIGWAGEQSGKVGTFRQFAGENSGQVFDSKTVVDEGAMVQTAIGQRDVRMTPLQGAFMVSVLLHGKNVNRPRIASEIRYANGLLKEKFPYRRAALAGTPISSAASQELLKDMQKVVATGTGAKLRKSAWKIAGKTGTAQVFSQGKEKTNQWFVGYFPADKPRYIISVLIKNMPKQPANAALHVTGMIVADMAATSKTAIQ
ncbi:MAG TPA: penicillin-binding protein 2 [Bacilli bacterium]